MYAVIVYSYIDSFIFGDLVDSSIWIFNSTHSADWYFKLFCRPQLIRDILNVSEATLGSPSPSSLGKYRALRCSIEVVPPQNPEFHVVSQLLQER